MKVLKLNNLIEAKVVNRPSKNIKSPYLADIKLSNKTKLEMAHSPALGLCGYITKDSIVLLEEKEITKNRKTKYTIEMVKVLNERRKSIWLGANPIRSNQLFKNLILKNRLEYFKNITKFKQEFRFLNSRFDFYLENKNKKYIVEIKNVPIVDFLETNLDSAPKNTRVAIREKGEKKSAIFPDGYQYKKGDCVSPRAYKQLQDLITIKKKFPEYIPCCIYLIQRDDVYSFKPNFKKDPKYSKKLLDAKETGVIIKAFCFKATPKGYFFKKEVPVIFED